MKNIIYNVTEAVCLVITLAFAALFVIGCLCADDYSAPGIPAAMQGWDGGAK